MNAEILLTARAQIVETAVAAALAVPNWTGLNPLELARAGRLTTNTAKDYATSAAEVACGVWFEAYGLESYIKMRSGFIKLFADAVTAEYIKHNR
jgi:hypothetical protein